MKREKFETQYYKVAMQLQGIIEEYMLQQGVAQNPRIGTWHNGNEERSERRGYRQNKPKLLEIKLPEFNGDVTK